MRIASTPGGVLTVVISLIYVGLMVLILAIPSQGYFVYLISEGAFPTTKVLHASIMVVLLNIITLAIPLRLGLRALRETDL